MTDFTAETLRMDAIRLIEKIPAAEMKRVWHALNNLYEEVRPRTPAELELKKQGAIKALETLEKIRNQVKESPQEIPADFDYKEEWHKHLDEKYGYGA